MKHFILIGLLMTASLSASPAAVRTSGSFEITQLTDQIYRLTTDEGAYTTNVLVFVGDDGLLLVDTNTEEKASELKAVVESFGRGLPRYIINTHRHVEHVGGNAVFGSTPVVIAHSLVPSKLRSGSYLFAEFPAETFPDITFSDSLTLFFNGETIRLVAVAGSHDDNEIMVHFTKSRVVHLSSLINGMNFPSVDSDGDPLKFEELVTRAITLLPEDVTIVSGHNGLATWQDLHAYRDMLHQTTAIVRDGLAAGKDVATLQEENALAAYEAFNKSYVSPSRWIEYLANAIENEQHPKPKKASIYEPIYYALKEGGASRAVSTYYELKNDPQNGYEIDEMNLLVIGDKLVEKDRLPEAIELLELGLKEFPEGKYAYYAHYDLSRAHQKSGDKKSAIEHCSRALELKPDFKAGAALMEELQKM